jgi:hypothetical protein
MASSGAAPACCYFNPVLQLYGWQSSVKGMTQPPWRPSAPAAALDPPGASAGLQVCHPNRAAQRCAGLLRAGGNGTADADEISEPSAWQHPGWLQVVLSHLDGTLTRIRWGARARELIWDLSCC